MGEKMKNKIFAFIGVILFVFVMAIAYIGITFYKQERILKQEITEVSSKDLFKDNYSIDIKTTGSYSKIESSIKKYYRELANNSKTIKKNLEDKELGQIMTIDNFKNDGTKFQKSQEKLDKAIENNNRAMKNITNLCQDKTIKNYIASDNLDNYYMNLYKELMYNEKNLNNLKEVEKEIKTISDDLDKFYTKEKEILTFLAKNDRHWEIKDNQLYFGVSDLADEYNKLYKELVEISKKFNDTDKKEIPSISSL